MICITIPKLFRRFSGCAVWPFILIREEGLKRNKVFINHERIHLRQQVELLVLPFYVWYLSEYVYYRVKGYSQEKAYRSICFEREAYDNENNLDYLKSRKYWSFIRRS